MITANTITISRAVPAQREAIIDLLKTEKLPVDDLPVSLHHFFVAAEEGRLAGAIGLEPYGPCGLLRSLVVSPAFRNQQLAAQLIQELESDAHSMGLDYLYLLTETAASYFERKGYVRIKREEVPAALQASSEFSHVCPASAIVFKKLLLK